MDVVWKNNRSGPGSAIKFHLDKSGSLTARPIGYTYLWSNWDGKLHLSSKNEKGGKIREEDIQIELENCHALMKGCQQKTFNLSELNYRQKKDILLNGLQTRNITVHGGKIIIHAKP
jgi:hypothetical protein